MQLIDITELIIARACVRSLAQTILRAERWVTLPPSLFERRRTLTHPMQTRQEDAQHHPSITSSTFGGDIGKL
jgi:hypothetical protein